jgi:hypothetical protein
LAKLEIDAALADPTIKGATATELVVVKQFSGSACEIRDN